MTTTDLNAANRDEGATPNSSSSFRLVLPGSPWRQAVVDIVGGAIAWQSWTMLGWHDIRQRYRRSTLGPFWITITMGVTVGSIGFVFGALLGQNMHEFLPYLAAGNIIWALLSTLILDGCMAFISSEQVIRQIKLPYAMHIYRIVWRTIIIFGHNIWIYVAAAALFGGWPNEDTWFVIPGFALTVFNGAWLALILAVFCARFRDIPLIVTSALQLLYLATPIVWRPDSLHGSRSFIYEYNPLFHLLELVRAPLLGHAPTAANWAVGIGLGVLGWALTFVVFARYRWRIPYWI